MKIKDLLLLLENAPNKEKEMNKKYPEIEELSMGMSHDYRIAYEEGSTMFRIGSILFGQRR